MSVSAKLAPTTTLSVLNLLHTSMLALNTSLALIVLVAAACCSIASASAPGLAHMQRLLQDASDADICKTEVGNIFTCSCALWLLTIVDQTKTNMRMIAI
jgi:hypothetical protein